MVKIVTDSASDIPPQVARELDITMVPIWIHFGNETYRDSVDLSTEEFYPRLMRNRTLPTTSAPLPGEFARVFDRLAEETDEILAIMLSSKYSVTYEMALKGKKEMRRNCRVEVIDSLSAIMGEGLMCIAAAREAKRGANLDQVAATVREAIPKTQVRMSFDTLEYLRRGGRIGRAQSLLGTILKVNPIAGIKDGETYPFGRERSRQKAIEWLYNFATGFTNIKQLAVEYATTPDEAQILIERFDPIFPKEHIYISTVSPVVGTHVGPHVLAVSVLEG
jgi:DegV family protein with EDD domain